MTWKIDLLVHQSQALEQALAIESGKVYEMILTDNYGILAMPTGSGKSYVSLAICGHPVNKPIKVETGVYTNIECNRSNVIVVPRNLISQWEGYVKNTDFTYSVFSNKKSMTNDIKEINLVSTQVYFDFAEKFHTETFSRLFIDEALNISIPKFTISHKIKYRFLWLISSNIPEFTYIARSNSNRLKSLGVPSHDISENKLNYLMIQMCAKYIKECMRVPMYRLTKIQCKTRFRTVTSGLVSNDIIELIESGDINSAATVLGVQVTDGDNIISLLNAKHLEKIAKLEEEIRNSNDETSNLRRQLKIVNLKSKIADISERIESTNSCPITLEEITDPCYVNCCNNKFSVQGLIQFMASRSNPKCPMCRKPLAVNGLIFGAHVEEYNEETKIDYSKMSKTEVCSDLLRKLTYKKIVVFTHSDAFCERGKLLNGTTSSNLKKLNWFKETSEEQRVLYLNSRTQAEGLNLEMADCMIIFDTYNSCKMNQMINRSHRYGRSNPLELIILE